jgi:GTPase SAR1 family protein
MGDLMVPQLRYQPRRLSLELEKLRLCVFGEPGVGKTTFSLTFPRAFVVDTDGGLISGAIQGYDPWTYEPTGWREFEAIYFHAKKHADEIDTIVLDSLTSLQRLLLDEIVDDTSDVKTPDKPVMQFVPERGMYLANQRQIARILTDFRRLGKHLVVTAGVRQAKTDAGVPYGPKFPDAAPGLMSIINYWSSVIGEIVARDKDQDGKPLPEPVRALYTGPSNERVTKSRFRSLMPFVPQPTYDAVWSRVEAEYKAAIAARNGSKTQPKETK